MMRVLFGFVLGFAVGGPFGVMVVAKEPNGTIAKAAALIKLIWGLMLS